MCVLTIPGSTYLPVASMTASATCWPADGPTRAISPSSTSTSTGPNGGFALP
jgi:hypothetical protein